MNEQKRSDIHLRPRFKMEFEESHQNLIEKFKAISKNKTSKFGIVISDGHVIIDIPAEENHFWSPQLSVEIEVIDESNSAIKGLFGPKPQVWTLFMFIHFAMAVAFIGFSIMAYVKWILKSDYKTALMIVFALPILWIVMYFLGRLGRKRGHKQMDELYGFLMETLKS
ncbi:MAG: GTP-binding protein [Lutibacter sp.]|nr:GTP-binding protein [Lutibacter sp.]